MVSHGQVSVDCWEVGLLVCCSDLWSHWDRLGLEEFRIVVEGLEVGLGRGSDSKRRKPLRESEPW